MTSHAVIINNGARSAETTLKTFDTKAAATAFVLEVYGQSAPAQTLVVVGWDETHGEVHGLFLCGEDCTEHTDDGSGRVGQLPVSDTAGNALLPLTQSLETAAFEARTDRLAGH